LENKKWIGIRGLVRGNGHWGDFPEVLKAIDPNIDFEMTEIPGNGTRNGEISPITVEETIEAIRAKSRIVRENKSFNLIGISLGGMIGLKWAELYPDEVAKLVVINSSLTQCSPIHKRLQVKQYGNLFRAIKSKSVRKRELLMLDISSNNHERSRKLLNQLADFSKLNPVQLKNFFRQLVLAGQIKIKTQKFSAKTKVKILCSEYDNLVHFSCSKEIARKFSLPLVIHPTAGHDIPLDDPEWVAGQMINF
jgi:pimeloyl-ACP methyl ester carboxylesterase